MLDTPLSAFAFEDGHIDYTTTIYRVYGEMDSRFYTWSSNYYTFDYAWNRDSFRLWISGVLYGGAWGLFMSLQVLQDVAGFYLGMSLFASSTVTARGLLPAAPADYWLPEPLE